MDALWNSTVPQFSKCFLKSIPFWIPAIFLWIFATAEIYILLNGHRTRKLPPIPVNTYNIIRFLCIIIVILVNLVQMSYDLCYFEPFLRIFNQSDDNSSNFNSIYTATTNDISASILNIATFVNYLEFQFLFYNNFLFIIYRFYLPILLKFIDLKANILVV